VQDSFSKWIEALPIKGAKASTVSRKFMKDVVTRYGPPSKLLTDRGTQFIAAVFGKLCAFLGIRNSLTTAYRPMCNGSNERTHQELKRYLGIFMSSDGSETIIGNREWDTCVSYAAWAHNTAHHAVLKMTPYEVLFNREPTVAALGALGGDYQILERLIRVFDQVGNEPTTKEDVEVLRLIRMDRETAKVTQNRVKALLEKSQERWQAKIPPRLNQYAPGDQVLLRNMRATANSMLPRYTGPYTVLDVLSPVSYEIERPEPHYNQQGNKDIVHIDLLKPYFAPSTRHGQEVLFQEPDGLHKSTPIVQQTETEMLDEENPRVLIIHTPKNFAQTFAPPLDIGPMPVIIDPSNPEERLEPVTGDKSAPQASNEQFDDGGISDLEEVEVDNTKSPTPWTHDVKRGVIPVSIPDPEKATKSKGFLSNIMTRIKAKTMGFKPPELFKN